MRFDNPKDIEKMSCLTLQEWNALRLYGKYRRMLVHYKYKQLNILGHLVEQGVDLEEIKKQQANRVKERRSLKPRGIYKRKPRTSVRKTSTTEPSKDKIPSNEGSNDKPSNEPVRDEPSKNKPQLDFEIRSKEPSKGGNSTIPTSNMNQEQLRSISENIDIIYRNLYKNNASILKLDSESSSHDKSISLINMEIKNLMEATTSYLKFLTNLDKPFERIKTTEEENERLKKTISEQNDKISSMDTILDIIRSTFINYETRYNSESDLLKQVIEQNTTLIERMKRQEEDILKLKEQISKYEGFEDSDII